MFLVSRKLAFLSLVISSIASTTVLASPSIYPTGVTRYDPSKAYNSHVLLAGQKNTIDRPE